MAKKLTIIVAGGSGTRMGASVPKQFLPLCGRPVLMHTVEVFARVADNRVVVVLPAQQMEAWANLCRQHNFSIEHQVVAGGNTRHGSVSNGLKALKDEELVAVHDGVRPLVSTEAIERCFGMAATEGTAVPVMPSTESVRMTESDGSSHAVDRSTVMMVQTPQVFRADIISHAYALPYSPLFTDDASVAEAAGYKISLCEGNSENIKLTRPADMIFAEALMKNKQNKA